MKTLWSLFIIGLAYLSEAQTLVVLGTLQDGGSPHMSCNKSCCAMDRPNDYVVSLGVIEESKHLLFDATPDIVEQTNYLQSISPAKDLAIFLTHAHMGHYAGLIHLGRESANTNQTPVYAMPRMAQFLQNNGPWSQLIDLENISIKPLQNKTPVSVSPRLSITPLIVPHRDEFVNITKTYAYPKPFLKDKKIRTYVTHGAPSIPVRTLYLNSVKLRLVMGVYSFVFGWRLSLWFKTKQFWSVPFVSQKKREKYLRIVKKDIQRDLKLSSK